MQQAEALRLSILKKAFEGKLVKQNPKDEPAQKLLERIRAEKEKKSAAPKGPNTPTKGETLRKKKTLSAKSPERA